MHKNRKFSSPASPIFLEIRKDSFEKSACWEAKFFDFVHIHNYSTRPKTEFSILALLLGHRGKVFTLEQIYENVWNEDSILNAESTVSVHVRNLRKKIGDDMKNPKLIKTVWGVGYLVEKE